MATKNDITGDSIQTGVASESYRDGWDRIYAKKTPDEWLKDPEFSYVKYILDPDGWRSDNTPLDKPINRAEFSRRLSYSTVSIYVNDKSETNT